MGHLKWLILSKISLFLREFLLFLELLDIRRQLSLSRMLVLIQLHKLIPFITLISIDRAHLIFLSWCCSNRNILRRLKDTKRLINDLWAFEPIIHTINVSANGCQIKTCGPLIDDEREHEDKLSWWQPSSDWVELVTLLQQQLRLCHCWSDGDSKHCCTMTLMMINFYC